MQPLPPNKSALATNFKVGDPVKWMISQQSISPYVGRVSAVCPGINKLWVEFPIGGSTQLSPEDLILVPPEQGISPVQFDTGYSSYDKEVSRRDYGTLSDPKVVKLAQNLLKNHPGAFDEGEHLLKMASRVAQKFASETVDTLASDILACFKEGMSEVGAYQAVYQKYGQRCSDGFLRHAVQKVSATQRPSE